MKLRFSFIFVFVALFAVSVCAEDIAYIVKDTSRLNHDFLNAISDLGLSVRVVDDNSIGSVNLANFKMMLVGNDRFDVPNSIPVNDYPTLMSNQYYMDDWGWVSTISSVGSSQPLQARNVYLNQITEGLPEYVQVYNTCCYNGASIPMFYLAKEKRPVKLRTVTSTVNDKLDSVIAISAKGTALRDGKVSKAKGLFFGITESGEWTQNAEALFKNSIMWLVNQPPTLTGSIPNVAFDEDTQLVDAYDLEDYFVDEEGDDITYSMTGGTRVKANIDGSMVTLYADANWYGSEQVRFVATSTDQSTQSNLVTVTVNSVNDAPVLAELPDMTFVEKDFIDINATATDIDGDTVTITYSSPLNSRGEWQTQLGDEGVYTIEVTADDMRGGTDSASFDITVLPKVYVNEFSLQGWVELYNPNDYDTDMASWTLESSSQTIAIDDVIDAKGFLVFNLNLAANDRILLKYDGVVVDSVAFGAFNDGNTADNAPSPAVPKSAARKSDGYDTKNNKFDFIILELHTKGLSNLADVTPPVVALISPDDGFVFTDLSRATSARFSVSDNKASELECEFFMDESGEFESLASITVRSGNVGIFTLSDLEDRTYVWNVRCFDGNNYAFAPSNRTLIVDVNDPPEIVEYSPEDLSPEMYENDSLEFTQTSIDPEGQPLTYSWAVNGVEKSTSESFVYVTGFFDAGKRKVKLTVKDSGGRTASNEWEVTVINVNRAPYLAVEIPLLNFDEDKLGVFDLRDSFADDDKESLSYEVVDEDVSEVHCSIGLSKLYMEPARDYNGEASCVIVATDGIDYSDEVTVNMLVNPINDAPRQVEDIPGQTWDEDTSLDAAFDLDDYFVDVDGDVLTYTFTGNSNITITIDEDNVVSFSQPDDWYGIEYVKFIASDGNLTDDSNSVRLQVRNVNDAPDFLQIPEQVLDEDTEITLDVAPYFSDKEGASLKYRVADEDVSKVDCSVTGSTLTIKPAENFFGSASCSIVANDGSLDSEENVVSIVVNPVDDAPTFDGPISVDPWDEDTDNLDALNLDDYFEDVDGDVLTYTVAGNSNINVSIEGSIVSFSQPADWYGSETVVFTASDLTNSVSSNEVILTVIDVNELPVLTLIPEQFIEEDSTYDPDDGCSDECSGSSCDPGYYVVPYIGDIDGAVSSDWFFFYQQLADFHDSNELPSCFSFFPGTMSEHTSFRDAFRKMYSSDYVELVQKGYDGGLDDQRMDELSYDEQKALVQKGLDAFEGNMTEMLGSSDVMLPVTYDQMGARFTEVTRQVLIDLGFNTYFDVYVADGLAPVSPTDDFDVLQYGVSFTVTGGAGKETTFKTKDGIIREIKEFDRVDVPVTTIKGAKVIPLFAHHQDFESNSDPAQVDSAKWDIYTSTLASLKADPEVVLLTPEEVYELRHEPGCSSSNKVVLSASDEDGTIVSFSVIEEDLSKVDCEISGNTLIMVPAKDFFGDASCTVEVVDNDGGKDSKVVLIHVSNVNDAPVIDDYSPKYEVLITEDGSEQFSVAYHDVDKDPISVSWFVDDVLSSSGDVFNYTASGAGEFKVKAVVSDSVLEAEHEWDVRATDCPLTDVFTGSTTDFCSLSDEQLSNLDCVVLERPGYGKIDFCGSPMDLTDVVYLDSYIAIGSGFVAIDSVKLSPFARKPARITMYNVVSEGTPLIYYNNAFTLDLRQLGAVCSSPLCSNIVYDGSTLEFDVAHFSSFKAVPSGSSAAKTCSELGGFVCSSGGNCTGSWLTASDTSFCCSVACSTTPDDKDNDNETFENLDTCSVGVVGNLDVEIKEPDSGDDFKPGGIITVEVKVRNKADKDLDVRVDVVLFDKDDDDVLDDDSDDVDIDRKDDETLMFELKVPKNVDEDNDIIIYAKAFEEGNEDKHCNDDRIDIDIKRKKHDVILDEIKLTPRTLVCDTSFVVSFTADNIGGDDETLYFTVRQSALGVDFKSELFDLDEGDDIFRSLTSKIPEGSAKGYYPVELTLYFDDGGIADSEILDLNILECVTEGVTKEGIPIIAGVPSPEGVATLTLLLSSFDVEPGASITVPAVVKNTGKSTVTFGLDAPATRSYANILDKPKFTLKPGQSTTVYLYLNTKADASEGRYSASVDLMVDGLVVDSKLISVELDREVEKEPIQAVFIPGLSLGTLSLVFVTVLVVIFFIFALVWSTYKPKRRRF